jgi:hypothetical protein
MAEPKADSTKGAPVIDQVAAIKLGLVASQKLDDELKRARNRHARARVAARIVTSELERVDSALAVALNTDVWKLRREHLDIPAWEAHRETLADLLDDKTWDMVDAAVTTPGEVYELYFRPQSPTPTGDETTLARFVAWHAREDNALARANLVKYAAKLPVWRRLLFMKSTVWFRKMYTIMSSVEVPPDLRRMAERGGDDSGDSGANGDSVSPPSRRTTSERRS